MVKGVNRQIIEINDTGNRYFEKVLLFVSPRGSDLNSAQLGREAKEFLLRLTPEPDNRESLRKRVGKRILRRKIFIISGIAAFLITGTLLIFNFL